MERFQRYPSPSDPSRHIRASFEDDARPLRAWDLDIALRLLDWSREDFLQLAGSLLPDFLERPENEQRWKTWDDLLGHIWASENAILGAMGAAVDLMTMPSDGVGRLQVVRARLRAALPEWTDVEMEREVLGEKWSPRKALRRALWHERDHTLQLEKVITRIP